MKWEVDTLVTSESTFGNRSSRPVLLRGVANDDIRFATEIPGVVRAGHGTLAMTYDAAPYVAHALNAGASPVPKAFSTQDAATLPGLQRYKDIGLGPKLRLYQKQGALFLVPRSYALLCDSMRLGKSATSIAAAILRGSHRTLIVCPAIAKNVWADEIKKWTGDSTLVLAGRGGNEARWFCVTCDGTGYVKLETGDENDKSILKKISRRKKRFVPAGKKPCEACAPKNGAPTGWPIADDVEAALDEARWVVCNYDLLTGHRTPDAAGKLENVSTLRGWAPVLSGVTFDVCVADEIHYIRGWTSDMSRKGQTRREKFNQATKHIPTVWGLTGTPIFGFVRDLWGPLDSISDGAMVSRGDRLPFSFHARYCEGQKDDYGWKADGRSPYAETELVGRMNLVKLQRSRQDVGVQLPPKIRKIERIEADAKALKGSMGAGILNRKSIGVSASTESTLRKILTRTLKLKKDVLMENCTTEMLQGTGEKIIVLTLTRDNAEMVAKWLREALSEKDVAVKSRSMNANVWRVHGDVSSDGRFRQAQEFREHKGAAAFVATIDSIPGAISLRGASSVHFADLHWQPAAMLQAEDRPYEPGTNGLGITYYVVKNSLDEHVAETVLPKVETLSRILSEKVADDIKKTLLQKTEVDVKALLTRMLASIPNDVEIGDVEFGGNE